MSLNPDGAPPGYYYQAGATAYLIDPAGTYSAAGASAPTTDPAGSYSAAGASAPTLAAAGTYIPVAGATSSAAEIVDAAGTYSAAGASAPTTDAAGTYSAAKASTPKLAAAGTYIPVTGATSSAAELIDPAGTFSAAGASAPKLAAAGTYIPVTGATSSAAEIVDPAGTYSAAGASAPMLAAAGTYIPVSRATSSAAETVDPAGTYSGAGATAPIADPGGTYSAAGASAPTTDPAGAFSSPYALDRLFVGINDPLPVGAILSFSSATAVTNFFGAGTEEAALANEYFAGYAGTSAEMLFTRYPIEGGRSHLRSGDLSNLTLSQLQSINGLLSVTVNGNTYAGSVNLSDVQSFSAAATAIANALNSNLTVLAQTTGDSIAPESVAFTGTINGYYLEVTSVGAGSIQLGSIVSGSGVPAGTEIVTQINGTPGGAGLYNLFNDGGVVSSESMTDSYGVLTLGSLSSGAVGSGELLSGSGIAANTAILANISGSGAGSTWIVNNAQTVAGATATVFAPPLAVKYDSFSANNDLFDVSEAGWYDYDYLPSTISYAQGAAALALDLTQASGAYLSNPGGQSTSASNFMDNFLQNVTSQFGSFQLINVPTLLGQYDPQYLTDFAAWANSTYNQYQDLANYTTTTLPAGSSAPTTDPAGTYSAAGAGAPTPDPAGTYSGAGASAPTTDPAGTYSAAGASAATTDPAGTYSAASASAPTTDPAGTCSAAGASVPTPAAAGTYISITGATSAAEEMVDPAGTYSAAGATAPTIDPAGAYSGAGASAPTTDPAGSYSLAGASAPTLAQPGYYVPAAGASSETPDDPGYYTPYAGATAEILALPPMISGTSAEQSVDSGQSDTPFASVTISDPNINTLDSLSIEVTGVGGALADGAGFSGLATSAPGVYTLSGTAAAITSELDALVFTSGPGVGTTTFTLNDTTSVGTSASDANTTVTILSGGTPVVSVATYLNEQSTLDPTLGGFDISDTAADITASLDELNDPNIDAIIVSDNGQVAASVQQLTSDAAAISKLFNQNGAPGQLAISDTAADITAELDSLDGSNIASITISDNGAVGVSVAELTSDAAAISKLANEGGAPGQLAISDTAADITAALNSLGGSNIASITISDDGAIGVSVAELTSDAAAIGELQNAGGGAYQLAVTDTAADITAALSSLDGSNIASITISDNGAVGVSVAQLTSDATAIGELQNAGGGAYQLAVTDTAADITAALNSLDGSNIASITIADDNAVGVSVAQLTSDAAAISKLANQNGAPGQLAISDTAADITAALDSLDGSNIASITISDNGAVGASVAQLTSDAAAISKLANQNGNPYELAVSDTAADITAGLNGLNGSNIASIAFSVDIAVGVSVAELTSDAAAISKLANQNGNPYQLAVSDTAADISAGLNGLNGSNIASITISDNNPVGVDIAQLTSDATAISKLADQNGNPYQLAVTDTAADITAALNSLDGSNIVSIAISDNGAVGVSVAQLTSDATAISKLANASGGAYQLAIADTASDVLAALATLEAGVAHIASINASNGPVVVSAATFLADQSTLDKIVGGFGVSDTLANIVANLSSLGGDSNVSSITATGGTVTVAASTFIADQKGLDKIVGGFDVSDTAAHVVAKLLNLNADPHAAAITVTSGSATLGAGAAINASNFAETDSGTSLTVGEALAYAGAFSQGAGSTTAISAGDSLTLSGTASLSGTTSGAGTLAIVGGSASIGSGAKVTASDWSISGSGASVTFGEALTYAGAFSEAASDTLALTGGALVLTGANDAFSGGTVDGSKFLYTEGTTAVSGLTIGGTVEWENTNTVNQRGGNVTLGDDIATDKAVLYNTPKAVYDILDNSGIGLGASTASYISNAGLLEKTSGTGASAITPAVINTGTIEVASGTLDFMRAVTGTGTDTISGASTLEFGAAVSSSPTVGSQNIGFTGGGTLDLTDPKAFWGEISDFAATDAIELLGSWKISSFSETGNTLATLTLASGATTHAFDFVGGYTRGDFKITSGATSTITYA
jgi:hypothetical protein